MMPIRPFLQHIPKLGTAVYIDPTAVVIGDVTLGADSSVWPLAVIRGDMNRIRIGSRTNVQDNSVLHITHAGPYSPQGYALTIGDEVTVGHRVVLHGCTIGNRCLIGIGSTVMDGAVVPDECFIGAGSLVPPNKQLEGGYLWLGNPVKRIRPLTNEELSFFTYSARIYVDLKNQYFENP